MMKYLLNPLLACLLFISATALAQSRDTTTLYLDSNLNMTAKAKAVCFEKIYVKDGLWQAVVQYVHKPYKVMSGSYKEKTLETAEGLFEYFKDDTLIMSGYYHDGAQSGAWKKWMPKGLITDSVYFDAGSVVSQAKFQYHENNTLWRYSLETKDNEKITKVYDAANVLLSSGSFKNNNGEMFFYHPNGKVKSHATYKNNVRTLYEVFDEQGNKIP